MKNESRAWAQFSKDYTEKVFCVSMFLAKRENLIAAIKPGNILDIGCGPVTFLLRELLRLKQVQVFATDFSLSMLKMARQSLKADNLLFLLADNRRLSFQDQSLDTVISVNSILPENRADSDLMFTEVFRILKPRGRFVAVLPAFETSIMARDKWEMKIQLDMENHREYDTTGWQSFYTQDDIYELMIRHKFSNYHVQPLYFTSDEEVAAIRKIYGNDISLKRLHEYPLFEHFLVAEK